MVAPKPSLQLTKAPNSKAGATSERQLSGNAYFRFGPVAVLQPPDLSGTKLSFTRCPS